MWISSWAAICFLIALISITSSAEVSDDFLCSSIADRATLADMTSCQYAMRYCHVHANLVDYYSMYYCWGPSLAIPILTLIAIASLSLLSSTASDFLLPTLRYLSSLLNLSPSVAGVTLLAFGNSAPDIFTTLAGMKIANIPLVLSSLVGSGLCITTLCLGLVLFMSQPKIENRVWLLRDIIIYLLATAMIIAICRAQEIRFWHGVAFIALYFMYASSVIFSFAFDSVPSKMISVDTIEDSTNYSLLHVDDNKYRVSGKEMRVYDFGPELNQAFDSSRDSSPSDIGRPKACILEFRRALERPITFLRRVTIPRLSGDYSVSERNRLILLPVTSSALFSITFLQGSPGNLRNFLNLGGFLASVIAFRMLPRAKRPCSPLLLATVGFFSSIAWLSIFASEMVAIVQAIGVFGDFSSATLGITILAIASSFGDLMTNITVARHGGAATAISACFGASILNDLLGLGIALTLTCWQTYPSPLRFSIDSHLTIGWAFLILSLSVSLAGFVLSNFQPNKSFGLLLIVIYTSFMAMTVLIL